jgi:hypothetical protein
MADPIGATAGKPKRAPQKKRPIFAIYTINNGELSDLILTKDSLEVLNKCEGSEYQYKRFDNLVLGR